MLSKNKIKYLASLADKKARIESSTFLVEGEKLVFEVLTSGYVVQDLLYTEKMSYVTRNRVSRLAVEKTPITEEEASKISSQKTPQGVFALVQIPALFYSEIIKYAKDEFILALHDIQDPGNLGTIVRTADWFGVKQIICSRATVDILNPKVLQSTMGAAFRVTMVYTDLKLKIQEIKNELPEIPIYAAILAGENIYKNTFPRKGILMMGNESKGLSDDLIRLATNKLTIPRFGNPDESSESLNVSVATAIILSELHRSM